MVKLTEAQAKIFQEWAHADVGFGYHFKALEQRTGLAREEIRSLVHGLRDHGYLEFMRGCWTEEGGAAGE